MAGKKLNLFRIELETARSLIRSAILSQLHVLEIRQGHTIVRDLRGLANQLVDVLSEPEYREALCRLSTVHSTTSPGHSRNAV